MVAATEVHQGFAFADARPYDLAHKDRMIAANGFLYDTTFKRRQGIVKQWSAGLSEMVGDAFELVGLAAGEMARQAFAVFGKNVHGKQSGLMDRGVAAQSPIDGNHDKLRIEGQRRKRTDRQAKVHIVQHCRHNGHTGREMTQDTPKFIFIYSQGRNLPVCERPSGNV